MEPEVSNDDTWTEANRYEPYVGRWSRLVAQEFVAWLGAPGGLSWLDVGCGTGALSHAVLTRSRPRLLVGVDRSFAYLRAARRGPGDRPGKLLVADALDLPFRPAQFDVVVSGLALNFVPDPGRAIVQMVRTLRPAGLLALYVWDYAGRMELMRYFWDAAVELDAGASQLDEGRRFPLCRPESLRDLFESHGLAQVDLRAIDVPTVFRDFDDYWIPFLGGQGPAPGYAVSLSEPDRRRLRDLIRSRLPRSADGAIPLVARAWAIQGRAAAVSET